MGREREREANEVWTTFSIASGSAKEKNTETPTPKNIRETD